MFNIEKINCPSCEAFIFGEMQADDLELIEASYENQPVTFKCYKCGYVITAKPDVTVSYYDIE